MPCSLRYCLCFLIAHMAMVEAEKARKTQTDISEFRLNEILTTKVTARHADQRDPAEDLEKVV